MFGALALAALLRPVKADAQPPLLAPITIEDAGGAVLAGAPVANAAGIALPHSNAERPRLGTLSLQSRLSGRSGWWCAPPEAPAASTMLP